MCFISIGFIFIGILKLFNKYIEKFSDKETEKEILVLYKLHCEILDKFGIYEKIFSNTIYAEIVLNGASLITQLLIISLNPRHELIYFSMSIMGSQVFIYCLFGQFIYSETERISQKFYFTNWYEMNEENRKVILTMMTMATRPFGLKAAGMYEINLILFLKVIKLCYTYYAILSKVKVLLIC
ncbi:odorant receptor 94b-like [Lutzomyia longipalpis]|uniref:odorant receptor 94b-like n=1 Tax=Lutzomyia longipalpis TaxID=7200 RepID=UPI0024838852|nr:odorant receptor 94b-like [Lutzomyia longipalpis]